MAPALIIAVGVIYAYIAINDFVRGDWAMAIVFAGYSFSNVGLWMASR
jgi:hypothetical protein